MTFANTQAGWGIVGNPFQEAFEDAYVKQMLHVLMISPLPPQETGESPYTAKLITELVNRFNMRVTAIAGKKAKSIQGLNEEIEVKGIWDGKDLLYPFKMMRRICRIRPHLVHVQFGPHGKVYGGLFGEPMLLLLILLKAAGIKTTVTLHSTWMPTQVEERVEKYGILSHLGFLARPVFRLYMKLLNWGTTTIQLSTSAVNSEVRREFLQNYEIKSCRVLEIPHPCRTNMNIPDRREAVRRLGLQGKQTVLIFGFIREEKGIELAIKAMETLRNDIPDVLLLVAGRPKGSRGRQHVGELKELRNELNLQNHVRFDTRFIPEREVPYYLAAASVLLIPYTESVGASGPIHNFAAYGTPIVAADVGYHIPEALGKSLVLFRSGDSQSLARSLQKILSNPDFASRIGQQHQKHAKEETWAIAALRTLGHYAKTLKFQ